MRKIICAGESAIEKKVSLIVDYIDINILTGKIISDIEIDHSESIIFILDNGDRYKLYHEQDCCESVYIEDICGDIDDLLDSPILLAEEVSSEDEGPLDEVDEIDGNYTWTFYKLATNKGSVTIRWYGTSNGYYSESVDFVKL